MLKTHLIHQLIKSRVYGLLGFIGLDVRGIYIIHTEVIPHYGFLKVQTQYSAAEGVTQGDPLSMCLSLIPLIKKLKSSEWSQTWYADDSACMGSLENVFIWFQKLMEEGPKYGEPTKSILVVNPQFKDKADLLFGKYGVKVVHGNRFLGGLDRGLCEEYVRSKVEKWVHSIQRLSIAAKHQSQAAAYAAVV